MYFNIAEKDPINPEKPGIWYDMLFIVQLSLTLGATYGPVISSLLPSWLLVDLEYLVLCVLTYDMIKKAVKKLIVDLPKIKNK